MGQCGLDCSGSGYGQLDTPVNAVINVRVP
jgi:hypothetical protein